MQAVSSLASPARIQSSPNPHVASYLARYEVDRRSVFVGNLPPGTGEIDVIQLFSRVGNTYNIEVKEFHSKYDGKSPTSSSIYFFH